MSDAIITVENLGKRYRIAHQRQSGKTLREALTTAGRGLVRGLIPNGKRSGENAAAQKSEEFWALRNVSFEVKQGEVVGFIGRNGAGKSTLLKLLSRITEPTEGRVHLRGRVASLLEVGTGFHPELTGRENIFLNGAILGMRREEIKRKFDEIVDFAGTEKFLDTPVKHYSSGMYVRLAFAVAAHLEPEILIVDEVLAVGDTEFQKKCLGKMQDVSRGGRTVLFVSHNLPIVNQLCDRVLLLQGGNIIDRGAPVDVVGRYLELDRTATEYKGTRSKDGKPKILLAKIAASMIGANPRLQVALTVWTEWDATCSVEMILSDRQGGPVGLASLGLINPDEIVCLSAGENQFSCEIALPSLACGSYTLSIQLARPWIEFYDKSECRLGFEVSGSGEGGSHRPMEQRWGYGSLELPLKMTRCQNSE